MPEWQGLRAAGLRRGQRLALRVSRLAVPAADPDADRDGRRIQAVPERAADPVLEVLRPELPEASRSARQVWLPQAACRALAQHRELEAALRPDVTV